MVSRFWRAGSNNAIAPGCNFLADVAASTVWNAATSNAGYTLSGGNLTATRSSGTGDATVFASSSHSGTGDWSYTVTFGGATGSLNIGFANASHANNDWVGDSTNSIGAASDGTIWRGGSAVGTLAFTASDSITTRLKNNKLYFAKNGTYLVGDPVAETGGIDVSTMGALFPACSTNNTRSFTADFTSWP
jgi:hypothetical protein